MFINDETPNTVVENTSTFIETFLGGKQDIINDSDKYSFYKKVDLTDIKAFLGLLYLRACLKLNMFDRETTWHHETANDYFEATMPFHRFAFISRSTTFDEKSTQAGPWRYDKFACMRSFFESFNKNISKFRYPSSYLVVDETLYPYSGRIGFKQYRPNNPAKYGLLYRSLCDTTVPYTYFSLPYVGKQEVLDKENSATSYYVTGTDEYTKYLVNGFSTVANMSGCNISMDRYFTSVPLAQWCLERNMTIVGAMRLDRKGFPAEIKKINKRDERSTIRGKDDDLMLVSYEDKYKSGKKNVVVLTSMHDNVRVTKDEKRKPQVHTFYNHTKGGVDVVDLISSNCSTRIKSKRWSLNSLAFILDMARTSANTILKENNVKMSTRKFTYQLARALCLPSVQRRYDSSNGIRVNQMMKIKRVLSINKEVRPIENKEQTGQCYVFVENILGTPSYISKRNKLNNKLKITCHSCNQIFCKDHYDYIF